MLEYVVPDPRTQATQSLERSGRSPARAFEGAEQRSPGVGARSAPR